APAATSFIDRYASDGKIKRTPGYGCSRKSFHRGWACNRRRLRSRDVVYWVRTSPAFSK
ncbi:A disintegrin and metalloproteinase with thrombospondin motifs 6, partial [Biomphalaria glabrata]